MTLRLAGVLKKSVKYGKILYSDRRFRFVEAGRTDAGNRREETIKDFLSYGQVADRSGKWQRIRKEKPTGM